LLKWAVTKRRASIYLPAEFEIHDLDTLLLSAGLAGHLQSEAGLGDMFAGLADGWGPELRYLAKPPEAREAEKLYRAICRAYDWILEQTV